MLKRKLTLACSVLIFFIATNVTYAGSSAGSNKPFTLSENLDVDPGSGAAALSIPVEITQGRGGIEPGVTLFYNSTAGNGLLGMGWNLELGNIQRSTRKGVPLYTSADTYVLVQSGSQQELVDVSGNGTLFKPEMEGSFSKIAFNGTTWTVTDKHGVKYTFGSTSATQVYDPSATTKVYKWMLERVEDLNGNYMTITYVRFDNNLFPSTINYTGNTVLSLPTHAQVKFSYESKTSASDLATSYSSGFFLGNFQRITNIESYVGTNLQRRYTMNYTAESQMGRSLLTSVTVKGDDGITTLPATVLNYSSSEFGYQLPITSSTIPAIDIGTWNLVRLMDMNGDGKLDIVDTRPNNYKIYLNQSASGAINFSSYIQAVNPPESSTDDPNVRVVDLNGDGLMDIIYQRSTGNYGIWINNGVNGYNTPVTASNATTLSLADGKTVQFMDMNGDGKLDMVETTQTNGGNWKIYFNTTGSDFAASIFAVNPPPLGPSNANIQFGDFNGDGLLDVIQGELPNYKILDQ